MFERPSLLAARTAKAISPSAKPISKTILSIGYTFPFTQESFEGGNGLSITRQDQCRAFVQDGIGFRVGALDVIRFDERDD